MSLFKTKEWWRTKCGVNETFDGRCLLVVRGLFGPETKDTVVVGSHEGVLRIYSPSAQWLEDEKSPSGYKSTDLLIETKISDCIVTVKAGRFVSGSQDLRLAVLTPSKLEVYSAIFSRGSTEHGDRCDLVPAYEHPLPRFPATLTCGPFGGARGRDFLCVQCLDGTLLFYEQESHAFSILLGNRLLPEPIVYVSRNDVFVTASSSWILQCYRHVLIASRYQNIAEFGRSKDRPGNDSRKTLEPDWSYNIGEAVLDIDAVVLNSFEVAIVVLGERNLYCLKDTCVSLKYAKRLDYKPVCFRAYVIEPDGKLMVLVIADTSTLMIYEGTTLEWSAQLPFGPVAVTRAHFQHLEGTIVVLSEEGHLEACYLGSEPSLFIAPPLQRRVFDYETAEKELADLRRLAKKSKQSGDGKAEINAETELVISVNVSPDLRPYPQAVKANENGPQEGQCSMCELTIELSSYTTLYDVQVYVDVPKPLIASENTHVISNLCGVQVLRVAIFPEAMREFPLPVLSSEVRIVASYETDQRQVRVVRAKPARLPLKMLLRHCPPESAPSQKISAVVKCGNSVLNFGQLFPEFSGNDFHRQSGNALGLRHVQSGRVCTIVSGGTSNRYRVQSNDGSSMALPVQQLIHRLGERVSTVGNLSGSVSQGHVRFVQSQMDIHFQSRQKVDDIMKEIGLLMSQLRNIERRLLRAIREKDSRPFGNSDGLPFLLESTYRAIFTLLDDLFVARLERERAEHELRSAIKLLLQLLRLNLKEDKYRLIESAIGFQVRPYDQVDWEEMADIALNALLRSNSNRAGNMESKPLTWNGFTTVKELTKLKKRLTHAVEQLDESDIVQEEATTP